MTTLFSSVGTFFRHPAVQLFSSLIVPLLFLLLYLGDTYKEPLHTTPVLFALLFLLVAVKWPRRTTEEYLTITSAWWTRATSLTAAGLLAFLLSPTLKYQGVVLYEHRPFGFWVSVAITCVSLLILLVRPPRPAIALGLLTVAGLSIRAWSNLQWDLNPVRSDMVPLIHSALEAFMAGENPYAFHQMQTNSLVPLTYPPLLWLSHLPAYLLGIDIRWTSWISDAIISLALGLAAIRRAPRMFGPVLLALATYLFLPDMHWAAIYAEPHFDWAIVVLLCLSVMSRKPKLAGVMYGIAMLTRPFNVLFAPFFCLWLWRRFGAREALHSLLISGVIAAVVYVPFVAPDPNIFYVGTVRWLLEYGPVHGHWFKGYIGFSGPLYAHKLGAWLTPIQLSGMAALIVWAFFKLRTTSHLFIFWLLTLAHFIAFNSLIWMNFWIGVFLLGTALLIGAEIGEREAIEDANSPPEPVSNWKNASKSSIAIEAAAALVVVGSLGFLLHGLYSYFSESGREELQTYLEQEVEKGDVILDRSVYRTAFLKKNYFFERDTLPAQTRLAEDPFTQVFPRRAALAPLAANRIWVVERYDLFEPFEKLYFGEGEATGPYQKGDDKMFGRYRLRRIDRVANASHRPISRHANDLSVSVTSADQKEPRQAFWNQDKWTFENAQGWQYVGPTTCKFYGIDQRMLWAHPWQDTTLQITAPRPAETSSLMILGGLNDRAASWGSSPVLLSVRSQDQTLKTIEFADGPGISGTTIALPDDATSITFDVTSSNDGRRHFCLDATFF